MDHLHSFLIGKILQKDISIPYDYFGKLYKVSVDRPVNPPHCAEESLSENFTDMSLADYVTSTPNKKRTSNKPFYFTMTSSTILERSIARVDKTKSEATMVKAGGLEKQLNIILDSCKAVFYETFQRSVNGILLYGPPGVGKSLLALNLCHVLKCTYRMVAGPELYSKFYGETEAKIRQTFDECRRVAPCVLILDDLDSLVSKGKDGDSGGDQERRVLSTLQTCLDRLRQEQSRD